MKNESLWQICQSPDLSTYDPYDIWKTSLGLKVKQLYNRKKPLAIIPAGLLTIFDLFLNNGSRLFYEKQEFPTVRAFATKILLNIYKQSKDPEYIRWAKTHLDWLVSNYSEGYSGSCWGLNMAWASNNVAIYDSKTPFITCTPYALEAFVEYQNLTKESRYEAVIVSVYDFISRDLYKHIDTPEMLSLSYSPVEENKPVINSNSYAMYCLSLLAPFLPQKEELIKNDVLRIYNFISSLQNKDGSWLYYASDEKNNFIDCFHTCFVLKNLIKTARNVSLPAQHKEVIRNGYEYLLNNLYDSEQGLFRRFSVAHKIDLVKFDLYDNAEMLNLAYLYGDMKIYRSLEENIRRYFVKGRNIYSVIDIFNNRRNSNMLRWAVMPYLHALSLAETSQDTQ
jgi:hypothetical protein